MGFIDIETKLKSLKAIWVAKLLKSKNTMYDIIKGYLNKLNVSPEYIVKTSEKNPDDFKLVEHLPVFYKQIFSSFNECKKTMSIQNMSMVDILLQPIWCNCLFKCKGKTLCLPNWIKSGFRYIRDLYNENGDIKSSGEILGQLIDKRNWMCEFKMLKTVLKTCHC